MRQRAYTPQDEVEDGGNDSVQSTTASSKNLDSPIFIFSLSNAFCKLEVGGELRVKSWFSTLSLCKSCVGEFASNFEYDLTVLGSQPNLRLSEDHLSILSIHISGSIQMEQKIFITFGGKFVGTGKLWEGEFFTYTLLNCFNFKLYIYVVPI